MKKYQVNLTADEVAHLMVALGFMCGGIAAREDARLAGVVKTNLELAQKISQAKVDEESAGIHGGLLP